MKIVKICPACDYSTTANLKKRKCPKCGAILKTKKIQGGANNRDGRIVMVCSNSAGCGCVITNLKKRKCPKCGATLEQRKKNHNGHSPKPKKMVFMRV